MPDAKHDSTKLGPAIFDAQELARRLARYGEEHTFPAATHGAQLLDALAGALRLASRGDAAAEQALKLAAAKLSHAIGQTPRVHDPGKVGPVAEALITKLAGYLEAHPAATAGELATILARHAAHAPGGHRAFPGEVTPARLERWSRAITKIKTTDDRRAYARSVLIECARADGMDRPADRLFGAEGKRQRRATRKRQKRK